MTSEVFKHSTRGLAGVVSQVCDTVGHNVVYLTAERLQVTPSFESSNRAGQAVACADSVACSLTPPKARDFLARPIRHSRRGKIRACGG